jgi:hypothetical protein
MSAALSLEELSRMDLGGASEGLEWAMDPSYASSPPLSDFDVSTSRSQFYSPKTQTHEQELDTSLVDRMQEWEAQRDLKLQAAMNQREQEEMQGFVGHPVINLNSSRIVERNGERAAKDVCERLYEDAERERMQRERQQEQHLVQQMSGAPTITRHAEKLLRTGDVTDRLYEQAMDLARRRYDAVEAHNRKQVEDTNMTTATGRKRQLLLAPQQQDGGAINNSTTFARGDMSSSFNGDTSALSQQRSFVSRGGIEHDPTVPIEDDLMRRAEEKKNREQQVSDRKEREEKRKMKPQINKRSQQLAAARASKPIEERSVAKSTTCSCSYSFPFTTIILAIPLQHPCSLCRLIFFFALRLKRGIGNFHPNSPTVGVYRRDDGERLDPECTFRPKINATSQRIAEELKSSEEESWMEGSGAVEDGYQERTADLTFQGKGGRSKAKADPYEYLYEKHAKTQHRLDRQREVCLIDSERCV